VEVHRTLGDFGLRKDVVEAHLAVATALLATQVLIVLRADPTVVPGRIHLEWFASMVRLGKPRITGMVVITFLGGLWLAPGDIAHWRTIMTLIGTALLVAASNALNMYLERDVDALMERTRDRPLPRAVVSPEAALAFEERLPNSEGQGGISMAELVRRSLRMNPSRVIVGEVLGDEIVTMLNAMTQGNDGSLSTIHANSSLEVFNRIATYAIQSAERLPVEATHMLIAGAIDFVVFIEKRNDYASGGRLRRYVSSIREVTGIDERVQSSEAFRKKQGGAVWNHWSHAPMSAANFARSMLPPETTATIFPEPARPLSAAAMAQPAAPSAITRARSAASFIARETWSSETTIDPESGASSGHIVVSTDLPPAPSTKDAVQLSKYRGRPAASDADSGAAVSGSAA
jgi:hypothetical protein